MRQNRFGRRLTFLAEQVFVSGFAEAVAAFLHEHAHVFGADGSRGFTDALTELLETVIGHRSEIDQYEARWDDARRAVLRERRSRAAGAEMRSLHDRVDAMGPDGLRELLKRLPPLTLKRLLDSPHQKDAEGELLEAFE